MTDIRDDSSVAATPDKVGRSRTGPVGVGVVGAGMISGAYLENMNAFPDLRVVMVGNRHVTRARAQAEMFGIAQAGTNDEVIAHPEVELVVNLTTPAVHATLSSAALSAGKHVWSEKPISTDRAGARALLDQASEAGLLLGVAPDTVLGAGLQTARRAIARGVIGTPLSVSTAIQYPGPELFHPNPEFLFAEGAGPLFDLGPYYLTALVHVFGPFSKVAAVGSKGLETRTIRVGDQAGTAFPVAVPTHVSAIAQFAGGGVAQSVFSFDSPLARLGIVEIAGTEATMQVPDPNNFGGDVRITRATAVENLMKSPEWVTVPSRGTVAGRGIGVVDMARCLRNGGVPMASGELGYHVLDTMTALVESMTHGEMVTVTSTVEPVPIVDDDWDPTIATL